MQLSKTKRFVTALISNIKKSQPNEVEGVVETLSTLFPTGNGTSNNDLDFARREIEIEALRWEVSKKVTQSQEKIRELICRVLLVASDAQTVTGMQSVL